MSSKFSSGLWKRLKEIFAPSTEPTTSPTSLEELLLSALAAQQGRSTTPLSDPTSTSTTSESPTISDLTTSELLLAASKVAESEWEGILLFGLEKIPNDENRFKMHKIVFGVEPAVYFCTQAIVRLAKIKLEEIDFGRDLDHTDKTKH